MGELAGNILGASLGPLKVKWWLLIITALSMALATWVKIQDNAEKRRIEAIKDSGAAEAVIEGQRRTLDQLSEANDAERELESGGERSAARYGECVQNARNPENCERFRPLGE